MTENIRKKIGKNIQRALDEKNITRRELAEKLKGSHQKISSWINGNHSPSLDVLNKIMSLTDKDANYFFGYPSSSCNSNNNIIGDNNHNIQQIVGDYEHSILGLEKKMDLIIQILKGGN